MQVTHVVADKDVLKGFVRRARRAYPNELVELLWGRVDGKAAYIHCLMPIEHQRTPRAVYFETEDLDDSRCQASEEGMSLLGTIHSHPDCEAAVPSERDFESANEDREIVSGICALTPTRKGVVKSRIEFWPRVKRCQQIIVVNHGR